MNGTSALCIKLTTNPTFDCGALCNPNPLKMLKKQAGVAGILFLCTNLTRSYTATLNTNQWFSKQKKNRQ